MEAKNLEDTVKKMGIVLEKVVQKIDELDKRVTKLEQQMLAEKGKEIKEQQSNQPQTQQNVTPTTHSGFGGSGFGTGFLSSMLGSFAGMSLFNLLFNHNVSAHELAQQTGVDDADLTEIDQKLEEIDQKIDELDEKIENIDQDLENAEFTDETLGEGIVDDDYLRNADFDYNDDGDLFDTGFDDFDI